jgi:hypothetical protein
LLVVEVVKEISAGALRQQVQAVVPAIMEMLEAVQAAAADVEQLEETQAVRPEVQQEPAEQQ